MKKILILCAILMIPSMASYAGRDDMEKFMADFENAKKNGKIVSQKKGKAINSNDPQKIAEVKEQVRQECLSDPKAE